MFWLIRAWLSVVLEDSNREPAVLSSQAAPDAGAAGFVGLVLTPWLFLLIAVVFPRIAEREFTGPAFGAGLFIIAIMVDRVAVRSERRTMAVKKVRKIRQQMTTFERKMVDMLSFPILIGIVVAETLIVRWILM